jgi:hypothetical protein
MATTDERSVTSSRRLCKSRRQAIPFTSAQSSVGLWLDYWLKNVVEHDREPTTYDAYEISLRLHIKPSANAQHFATPESHGPSNGDERLLTVVFDQEDIDLQNRTLTVGARVNRVRCRGLIVREGAKTAAGQRTVALPRLIVQALRAHRLRQIEDRLAAGDRWKGPDYHDAQATGFVFTSAVGTILEPSQRNPLVCQHAAQSRPRRAHVSRTPP